MDGLPLENDEGLDDALPDGAMLVATFKIGQADFGVDGRLVLEVIRVETLARVHGAPPEVVGIRNLRGRLVTVVDMAVHLGLGRVQPGPENRLLIMEGRGETVGFLVDAVTDAVFIEEKELFTAPVGMESGLRARVRGVRQDGNGLTAILDPDALFQWNGE